MDKAREQHNVLMDKGREQLQEMDLAWSELVETIRTLKTQES